ncbi:hypothetical protein JXB41_08965 [Candidatus Woesearchaeota archaeon]|nr:hypothetical protein [Candidatus Woesearchaeota archaeon]
MVRVKQDKNMGIISAEEKIKQLKTLEENTKKEIDDTRDKIKQLEEERKRKESQLMEAEHLMEDSIEEMTEEEEEGLKQLEELRKKREGILKEIGSESELENAVRETEVENAEEAGPQYGIAMEEGPNLYQGTAMNNEAGGTVYENYEDRWTPEEKNLYNNIKATLGEEIIDNISLGYKKKRGYP